MKTDDKDQELCIRFRKALDTEIDRLDETTRARLQQARLRAVVAAEGRRGTLLDVIHAWRWLTGGGLALAAASVAAIAIWLAQPSPHLLKSPDDVEIVAAQEQLELYEDLEFYRWLAGNGDTAGNHDKGGMQ